MHVRPDADVAQFDAGLILAGGWHDPHGDRPAVAHEVDRNLPVATGRDVEEQVVPGIHRMIGDRQELIAGTDPAISAADPAIRTPTTAG